MPFQKAGDSRINRGWHVWRRRDDGTYKCVLCGGVTRRPTDNDLPERFEPVTAEDALLCPRPLDVLRR